MKRILFLLFSFVLLAVTAAQAQVKFSVSTKRVSPTEIDVVFTGNIASGWHVYGTDIAPGGRRWPLLAPMCSKAPNSKAPFAPERA